MLKVGQCGIIRKRQVGSTDRQIDRQIEKEVFMQDRQIAVYVRREGREARTLSFNPPPEVSQKEALDKGFAIDGNSYVLGITGDSIVGSEVISGSSLGPHLEVLRPLSVVLADSQREITNWLGKLGYEVTFK